MDLRCYLIVYRYIYCEVADITLHTAVSLMYAAEKYLLTGLVKEIMRVVEPLVDANTVCTLLEQSMLFLGANEVKEKCFNFFRQNAHHIFNTEKCVHLSQNALKEIVRLDCLALASEKQVYETCIKWARHQLLEEEDIEPLSDEEIREQLGNILYKIRFPVMTAKDFAELTAESTVLTAEERVQVYDYITLGKKPDSFRFMTKRRRMGGDLIQRFDKISRNWKLNGSTDAISFSTTVDIYLTGVCLYGGTEASTHDIKIYVSDKDDTLSTLGVKLKSGGGRKHTGKIELDHAVHIHANNRYTVEVVMEGPDTWYGKDGKREYDISGSGKIRFYKSRKSESGSDVNHGQIPALLYYLA